MTLRRRDWLAWLAWAGLTAAPAQAALRKRTKAAGRVTPQRTRTSTKAARAGTRKPRPAVAPAAPAAVAARHAGTSWSITSARAPEPLHCLQRNDDGSLLAVGASGTLWNLEGAGWNWRRRVWSLAPTSRLATGHGRIVGRHRDGGLTVIENRRMLVNLNVQLAPDAGMLVLPDAVLAITRGEAAWVLARFQHASASDTWEIVARASEAMVPAARPTLAMLGPDGHPAVCVLAGPDARRHAHQAFGEAAPATRALALDPLTLKPRRSFDLPAPLVFDDLELRPVRNGQATQLLTVLAGNGGSRLVLLGPDPKAGQALAVAAAGPLVSEPDDWLAPSTDGSAIAAVHGPHDSGVLYGYRIQDDELRPRMVTDGVMGHVRGSPEAPLITWLGTGQLLVPLAGRRAVQVYTAGRDTWDDGARVTLAAPLVAALPLQRQGAHGAALLLEDGSLAWLART